MKKICIVTGTRAEWGLLTRLAGLIAADPELQLQIVATHMHLSARYGETSKEIESDGFAIDYRVPTIDETATEDTPQETVMEMSRALSGFARAYDALKPDLIIVLGDRYEILCAVEAALIFRIPVAHLHGGEITEGAFDDAIRHAITKMSHLHFTSTEAYRQRVIQLGEDPATVYNVGAIGVDNIRQIPLWSQAQTEESLGGFPIDRQTLLVTYHPVTLDEQSDAEQQIDALLGALDDTMRTRAGVRVIFTMPNSDTGSGVIAERIRTWCAEASRNKRCVWFTSLGLKRYLSVLQYIGGVVGNSSSGIVEVPSFRIPTIDIGDRQRGRIAAPSVVHCGTTQEEIIEKLSLLLTGGIPATGFNPYERPDTAIRIYETIKKHLGGQALAVQKHFHDLPHTTTE
ncbi:UDP-N-acetylglucosamine 2-epimerase [uncultured Rikenella sp.]|uniref:UDP-N-acetylglucosamine 2-epimerase n=1 Tax=uncultured Rikenella sp. TaxID=368003 RepID=UPI0026004A66|nr:UDP-N-acetylglucosamine 2-epimerase [uncultured Rikenella sp.]